MAQLDVLMKNDLMKGVAIGLGIAVLVPAAVVALAPVLRPVARSAMKAGILAYEKTREEKETLLDVASRHAAEQGVRAMASAIVAHNIPSAILSVAEMESPDFVVMGWKGEAKIPQLRRTNVADVLRLAKGNVLVLKDRGIENVSRILVPLGGGPHAQLGFSFDRSEAPGHDTNRGARSLSPPMSVRLRSRPSKR